MGKLGVGVHACPLSTWEVKEVTTLGLKSVRDRDMGWGGRDDKAKKEIQ